MSDTKEGIHSVGIIMDGNRRWAKANGLPSSEGHSQGRQKLKEVCRWAKKEGIGNLFVYALSTENWKRAKEEVGFLIKLIEIFLAEDITELIEEETRFVCAGDISRFSEGMQIKLREAERSTAHLKKLTLVVCLSYGGRDEILQAVNKILAEKLSGKISEEDFSARLYSAGIPDPELIIRTGGEMRLSNFLPWQSIYSELFFIKTFWPDFSQEEFVSILSTYMARKRNFGV